MNLEGSHKPCLSLVFLDQLVCLPRGEGREGKRTLVFPLIRVSGARGDREKTVYLFPVLWGGMGRHSPVYRVLLISLSMVRHFGWK